MGRETANIHLGSVHASHSVARDLKRRKADWLREAAEEMVAATLDDWKVWKRGLVAKTAQGCTAMSDEPSQGLGWLGFAILSAVFAALTNIFGKIGVEGIPSNMATLVRVVVILLITSGIVYWFGEWRSPHEMPSRTIVFLILSGCATGLSWLCGYRALQLGQASLVSPVDKLSVLLVMLMGVVLLGEKLSARQWLGGLAILIGVMLVAWPDSAKGHTQAAPVQSEAK